MSLVRRIARPLLAAPFIYEGVRTAVTPERSYDVAPRTFADADETLANTSSVPSGVNVKNIFRASGAISAGAGIMYATNSCPRAAAGVLLLTTTVGWAGRKRVWELTGEERLQEIQEILKDAGLLGGVLLAVVDLDGRPSLRWRTERFIERSQRNAARKQRQLQRSANRLSDKAGSTAKDLRKKAEQTGTDARKKAEQTGTDARKKAEQAREDARKKAEQTRKDVRKKAEQARKDARKKAQRTGKAARNAGPSKSGSNPAKKLSHQLG